jgi:POT family proton-dependent oligopeptide transporter
VGALLLLRHAGAADLLPDQALAVRRRKANLIYGAYTSLVYITPVLGGYLADRYLGQRKAVLFGGLLLTIGHSLMAVEGNGGQDDPTINVFWAALAFIIVGSGFLKANISVMVGQLYKLTDVRRDGAYTIFYMGINVGAAIGTILSATSARPMAGATASALPASACCSA